MPRYELNLRDYYRIIRRHIVVIAAMVVGMGGLTFMLTPTDVKYRATSTVRIVQATDLTGLILQAFYVSLTDNISTQTKMITSQPVLLEMAKRLVLIPEEVTQEEAVVDSLYREVLAALSRKIEAYQVEFSGLINIIATDDTREKAIELASTAAKAFEEYSLNVANRRNTDALEFIERQLANTTALLDSSEQGLKKSRRDNLPYSMADIASTMPLIEQRRTLLTRLTSLEEQMLRLGEGVAALSAQGTTLDEGVPQQYTSTYSQLSNMLADRTNLLLTYTESADPVRNLDDRIDEARVELLNTIQKDARLLRIQLDDLDSILDAYPDEEIRLAKLNRSVELYAELVAQLQTRRQEAMIRKAEQVREVTVIDYPASADPAQQSGRSLKTLIGLMLGVMLGMIVAFVLETMDTSIGTIEDVEEYLEVPVLTVIPHLDIDKMAARLVEQNPQLRDDPNLGRYAGLITQHDPRSPVAEAYRTLRTNLQFATAGAGEPKDEKRTFLFTSASLEEGKTTTLINLAITVAQAGNRTLLIGCNLRRPTIYKSFGLPRERGMTDILTGQMEWQDCVKTVTDMMLGTLSLQDIMAMPGLDNLHIITAGGIPPNPSELLNSPRFGELIAEASEQYDLVLIDSPPILPVTDAAIMGRQVDWSVLVYQVGKIPRNALRRAKAHLSNVGAHVLGIAMNDVRAEISGYSPYSQYMVKYYGEEAGARKTLLQRLSGLWSRKPGAPSEDKRAEWRQEPGIPANEEHPSWVEVDYFAEETEGEPPGAEPPETESPEADSNEK